LVPPGNALQNGVTVLPILASGGLLLVLDQWTKNLVQLHVRGRQISFGPIHIRRVISVRDIYACDSGRVALVLAWFTALFSAIILHRFGDWFQSPTAPVSLGLALGGAAGNLVDILRWRYVLDFIDLRWWPVFNLADVAIVGGLITAFWPRA
jgi:signal peptidase II